LGMIAWARTARLHPISGVIAAIGWGLCPKLIAHLGAGHLDLWYASAWVPWLLWGILHLRQESTIQRGVVVGILAAMLILADIRMAFYMLPTVGAYGALHQSNESPKRLLGWVVALIVLLGLIAAQIIPL